MPDVLSLDTLIDRGFPEGVSEVLEPTLDEMESGHDAVDRILGQLPDDERELLHEYIASGCNGREVGRRLGLDDRTFRRRLDGAMKSAATAAVKFYDTSDVEPPEQYIDDLEGVEVPSEPINRAERVLSVYRETKSIRKTAVRCGLSKSTVQRILDASA